MPFELDIPIVDELKAIADSAKKGIEQHAQSQKIIIGLLGGVLLTQTITMIILLSRRK